jgi:ribosome modulation factor
MDGSLRTAEQRVVAGCATALVAVSAFGSACDVRPCREVMPRTPLLVPDANGDAPALQQLSSQAAAIRGREAFLAGVSRASCPFAEGSLPRIWWLEGWDAAQSVRQALDHRWGREG